nr:Dynein assembly factor with WDR repeat domains 1 [Polyrhizophydium stewartii]
MATTTNAKLKRLLLRYFPPGVILEFEHAGALRIRPIDLLDLDVNSDVAALTQDIIDAEPLIPQSKAAQLQELLTRLKAKAAPSRLPHYELMRSLRAHVMPLTNCVFTKSGDRFITGSYDRICKLWDTASGAELLSLSGHQNVVYALAFNNPFGDKIATGSFDKTAKVTFNSQGSLLLTSSSDKTARLWDTSSGCCTQVLEGHHDEIFGSAFSYEGEYIATASKDNTVNLWIEASRQ